MIIKKGDQQVELSMDELGKLVNTVVDPPRGDWSNIRVLDEDVDLTPKVGGRAPKEGDEYWEIGSRGPVRQTSWKGEEVDVDTFKSGNGFWSEKEAEKELKRRKAEYRLKQIAAEAWAKYPNEDRARCVCLKYYDRESDEFALTVPPVESRVMLGIIKFPAKGATLSRSFVDNRQDWLDLLGLDVGKCKGIPFCD